jgi:hypothetical protein
MLAGGKQLLLVPGDHDDLTLHGSQYLGRQDELLRGHHRPPVELQQRLPAPEHLPAEGQDLPAEYVVLNGQRAHL